jgi:hypothetical protein
MLTNQDALALSRIIAEPGLFPEARQEFTRTLFDYYKELLSSNPLPPIPTPRRM